MIQNLNLLPPLEEDRHVLDSPLIHLDPERIQLFDFDGVLASPFEEALYCLPVNLRDAAFIKAAEARYQIPNHHESIKSIRYMMMQAVMMDMGHKIKAGPCRPDPNHPFMIITARSDYFSIYRMMEFLSAAEMFPIQIFNVGDTPKKETIRVLLEKHPEAQFEYWDDRQAHIDGADSLRSPRLVTHYVDNDLDSFYEEAESYYRNILMDHIR